jgi:hypothetical protein
MIAMPIDRKISELESALHSCAKMAGKDSQLIRDIVKNTVGDLPINQI